MRFTLIIFLISIHISFVQTGSIQGKVTDGINPIPAVNVFITELETGDATNDKGFYQLRNLPAGKLEIRFSAVGYETEEVDVEIQPNKTIELNIKFITKNFEFSYWSITKIHR